MLVEFTVGNYRSIKTEQTLHLQAAPLKSSLPRMDQDNLFDAGDRLQLLRSKAIFGANASGKTNLISGLAAFKTIVGEGLQNPEVLQAQVQPFLLDWEGETKPSFFQIVFVLDGFQYRYGFEATSEAIVSEWLFSKPVDTSTHVRERFLFLRDGMSVDVNDLQYKEGTRFARTGKDQPTLFRVDSLFLPVVAAFNGSLALRITQFLEDNLLIVNGLDELSLQKNAIEHFSNPLFQQRATSLLQAVDPAIVRLEKVEFDREGRFLGHPAIAVVRNRFQADGTSEGETYMLMDRHEAEGTKKLFALSQYLFSALAQGCTLVIDEFDARMHPHLSRSIVDLFHSPETNPRRAQLIFATHDVNLLDSRLLRRDQVAFARKDFRGATEVYSLVEIKGVRNDASYEKEYLQGKYDAIPENLMALEEAVATYLTHGKAQTEGK